METGSMGVIICEDTRQQEHDGDKHATKHEWWAGHGISVVRMKLDFGDYMRGFDDGTLDPTSNVSVDTKQHLGEVSMNLGRGHERFKREIRRSNDAGYLLVVLVETDEARCIEDVRKWVNTHCMRCNVMRRRECDPTDSSGLCLKHGTKKPLQGETMARQMKTMQANRSVRFEFCKPDESAQIICELLGVSYDNQGD